MRNTMTDYWCTITLRGLIAVLVGIAALIWPHIALQTLTILFGVFVLFDGLVNLSLANRARLYHDRWWVLLVQGLVGAGIGIVSFVWPTITAVALVYFVAIWAIAIGLMEVTVGIRLGNRMDGGRLLVVCGVLSALFGSILIAWPDLALHGLIWLIGACALFFGSVLMFLGLKLRRLGNIFNEEEFGEL
jgi:uncharacterized membrane protein HdeD (DUF308 family)